MFCRLANRVQIVQLGSTVYLVDDDLHELEGCSENGLKVLRLMQKGCTQAEVVELLGVSAAQDLIQALQGAGYLRKSPLPHESGTTFAKQLFYLDDFGDDPLLMQQRLQSSTVAIIGVGGVGAIALQHLVGAGVGSLVLVEPDQVNVDNLNRQYIYDRSQVGTAKAEAAAHYVQRINPDCRVAVLQVFVDRPEALEGLTAYRPDLIINAADQPAHIEHIINDHCTRYGVPFTTCAVGRHMGTWGPMVVPGHTPCMSCWLRAEDAQMNQIEREVRSRMNDRIAASFGPTNSVVASLMAKDILLYLATGGQVSSAGVRYAFEFESLCVKMTSLGDSGPCSCWKGA